MDGHGQGLVGWFAVMKNPTMMVIASGKRECIFVS
jgi:hypothetical protein